MACIKGIVRSPWQATCSMVVIDEREGEGDVKKAWLYAMDSCSVCWQGCHCAPWGGGVADMGR